MQIKDLTANPAPAFTDKIGVDNAANVTYYDTIGYFLNAPDGTVLNGKLAPTVSADDLVLTLQTTAGNTPSAAEPVWVKISGTWRSITAALSVTAADATNWFAAGGTPFATKEIDYFAYLGYNATDGVVIGFARFPYAALYSDFSATSTNEKFCKISTITNAAAGDNYVVIGRFAATLSATAAFTWTVPTYTTANLVQRPTYETRWLEWVPTTGAVGGGSFDSPSITKATYRFNHRNIEFWADVGGTITGTVTNVTLTLPFGPHADFNAASITMQYTDNTSTTARVGTGAIVDAGDVIRCRSFDSANWVAGTGALVRPCGFYRAN